ncbi:hypothetical protein HETIRDRAFT_99194 [Heterobasidion irregulare TC 32-1]|uniref:MRH domain-containing protein n=1 Tax=Heterobasidion irregulare (strain TC 32-1) TaxID=747525 RepID=W4KMZ9_HETIT|nr:uncharacterized protein HETIRDRAFT_99194 [Heterobasidion irregulare TC 32-1]ETW86750.1 hypothetical protein HETIRDRAFT_99194 [Heterobasidion irregulare TC 32-1]
MLRQKNNRVQLTGVAGTMIYGPFSRGVVHETWNPDVAHPENIAAFTRRGHGDFSLGEVNTTLLVRDRHPLLILTGGSPCTGADHLRASTAVRFICDTSVFGSGKPRLVAQLPPNDESACAFFIEWRTHLACPTSEPSGFWGGLIVGMSMIALVLVMLYLVGGTLYRRYVLQQRGFDQIPRVSSLDNMRVLGTMETVLAQASNDCRPFQKKRKQFWDQKATGKATGILSQMTPRERVIGTRASQAAT